MWANSRSRGQDAVFDTVTCFSKYNVMLYIVKLGRQRKGKTLDWGEEGGG